MATSHLRRPNPNAEFQDNLPAFKGMSVRCMATLLSSLVRICYDGRECPFDSPGPAATLHRASRSLAGDDQTRFRGKDGQPSQHARRCFSGGTHKSLHQEASPLLVHIRLQ